MFGDCKTSAGQLPSWPEAAELVSLCQSAAQQACSSSNPVFCAALLKLDTKFLSGAFTGGFSCFTDASLHCWGRAPGAHAASTEEVEHTSLDTRESCGASEGSSLTLDVNAWRNTSLTWWARPHLHKNLSTRVPEYTCRHSASLSACSFIFVFGLM